MSEALDYVGAGASAASISTITAPGWSASIPIAELREDALADAHRLIARGRQAGRPDRADRRDRARVRRLVLRRALCRRLAGAAAAADLVRRPRFLYRPARRPAEELRSRCSSSIPPELAAMAGAAAEAAGVEGIDWAELPGLGGGRRRRCPRPRPDDIAYLQYSSGSTRFPHGVAVTHEALLANLAAPCPQHEDRRRRPRRLLAAFLSRHGPGRLPALDRRQPDVGRLSQDRGFRPPPARLARPDQPRTKAPR